MKIRPKKKGSGDAQGDMTPMIDMTFQLIAFFMVLINFSQSEQNERVKLPESTLAKPPEGQIEFPITMHLTKEGTVFLAGTELEIDVLGPYLQREANLLAAQNKKTGEANIIIRADKDAQTGKVQELIKVCQENRFERFLLRALERVD